MHKLFFIQRYFLPAAFFSLAINLLLLAPSIYMLQLYDRVLATRSKEALWLLSMLLLVALVVMGLIEIVRSRLLVKANNAIDLMYGPTLFRSMAGRAVSPEGNQYFYALSDLYTIRTFLTGHGILGLFDAPWLPIYMLILYFMNPLLFYVLLIGSGLMIGLTIASELLTKRPLAEANAANRAASRFVDLTMKNAEVVNAMGMVGNMTHCWAALNNQALLLQYKASNRAGMISGVTKFVRQLIQAMGMGAGTYIILLDPSFTPGMMIAGGILFGKALGPIEFVISSWKTLLDARAAYGRLSAFMEEHCQEQPAPLELPPPTGQLTLEHVTFGIRAQNKVILRDISFSLAAGETLGVIGASASGKSSLARLLVGVWKPLQGVIRVDGADTNNWPADRLGQYIGYLPQDIELFAGSIAENIARLDLPDAEKVIAAATMAGLHDLILHLPQGYDTQIGDGGAVLSGGQRQRIGLARALYNNPRMVVLDEPNSSLDTDGEMALLQALDRLRELGTTTIIITHNPNFLNRVDKLLVMRDGTTAAFGPKEWVLAQLNKARQTASPTLAGHSAEAPHLVSSRQG